MFTIKFYGDGGLRTHIAEAESFTVLRPQLSGNVEITLHGVRLNGEIIEDRVDLMSFENRPPDEGIYYTKAIIENANGKTSEILYSDSEFARRAA